MALNAHSWRFLVTPRMSPESSRVGDKQRGNREVKKPKKVKEKVSATADSTKGKALTNLGEHKKK